jgi:hypothetical protein
MSAMNEVSARALAPIGQEAKPAADHRAFKVAEPVTDRQKTTPSGSKSRVPAAPINWAPKIPSH